VGVMIVDVLVQQPSQMSLIQHDHMIQEVAAYAAHPTLCNSVLPWAAESGANRLAAHRFHAGDDIGTELRVPIKKQEWLRRLALLPRFAQLYRNPKRLRVRCMPCEITNFPAVYFASVLGSISIACNASSASRHLRASRTRGRGKGEGAG